MIRLPRFLNDGHFLIRQAAIAWLLLLLASVLFATIATVLSLVAQNNTAILVISLVLTGSFLLVFHFLAYKQNYHFWSSFSFKSMLLSKQGRIFKLTIAGEGFEFVQIGNDSYIATKPITTAQYSKFVEGTQKVESKQSDEADENPVVNVSWNDAIAFCKWLSNNTSGEIRLPTESDWEKAAGSTGKHKYPWGNEFTTETANTSSGKPLNSKVSEYPATNNVVLNMSGNVWEWTNAVIEKEKIQPVQVKLMRGGSWEIRQTPPNFRNENLGFRIVYQERQIA